MDWCLEYGIKTLTLYTFSTENFDRPAEEVNAVLKLVEEEARKLGRDNRLHTQKVRVKALGRTDLLPESLQDALKKLEDDTSEYTGHFLNIAIAYTGRAEIVDATKKIVDDVYQGPRRPAVHPRDQPEPGPGHTDVRRRAPERLPSLAIRIQRTGLCRRLLARISKNRFLKGHQTLPEALQKIRPMRTRPTCE